MSNTIENFDYGLILKSSLLNDRLVLSINNINTTLLNILETIGNTELRTGILGTLHNLQTQIDRLSPATTIYLLYLDKTSLVFNHNNEGELIPTELTINVHCKKIQGNKTTIVDIPNTFHCTYGYGGSVYILNSPYTITVESSSIINQSYLYISLTDSDNETVDVISVPIIIDGINGTDGTSTIIKGNAINIELGDPHDIEDYYNENLDETILGDMILIDDNDDPDGHIIIKRVPEYYDEEREKTTNFTFIEVNIGDGYVIENNRITLPYEGHLFVASEHGEYGEFTNWRDSGRIAGKSGSSGYAFRTEPTSIIITETRGENDQKIYDVPKTITVKANVAGVDKNVALLNVEVPNNTINISFVLGLTSFNITGVSSNFEGTSIQIITSGTCDSKSFSLPINVYINRLGTTEISVKDDTIVEIAKKTGFYDTGQDVEQLDLMGQYVRSSEENVSILTKKINNGKNLIPVTSGWESQGGTPATFNKESFGVYSDEGDLYSPYIIVKNGEKYCFSAYMPDPIAEEDWYMAYATNNEFNPASDDLSDILDNGTNVSISLIKDQDDTIEVNGVTTSRYYYVITINPAMDNCYLIINLHSNDKIYCPQIELGDTPTKFAVDANETTSQIKQTANEIDLSIINKLSDTGIRIDGNNRSIHLNADNTYIEGNLTVPKLETTYESGHKIEIDGSKFNVYNTADTVGLSIGWDDGGNPFLLIANADGTKAYKLTYDGITEATENFTSDTFSQIYCKPLVLDHIYSSEDIENLYNINMSEYIVSYVYSAAKNLVTGAYQNSDDKGQIREERDGKTMTTNVITSVLGTDAPYLMGLQVTPFDILDRMLPLRVICKELYQYLNGVASVRGYIYIKHLDDMIDTYMFCDPSGRNETFRFDANHIYQR